jgi:predicted Zn finger-like uncharacterized protein
MLVQCPNCKTTYKVSDDVLKGAAPAFRCSRCRHTFELEAENPQDSTSESAVNGVKETPAPAQEPELSLAFPSKATDEVNTARAAETTADTTMIAAQPTEPINARIHANQEQWSINNRDAQKEPPFTLPGIIPAAEQEKIVEAGAEFTDHEEVLPNVRHEDETEDGKNILPMSSYIDQQASILPYLTLFGLLAIGFSLIAVFDHAHSKASEELIKKIPLIGASVLKNNHLKDGILIQSLRGGYQNIEGNREVFVVSGVAFNQNPVVVREIQLTGKLYNEAGKEMEQQTIWIGNTLSAKILRGMTLEEIPNLQSLKPLKSFEMPPGDSIPFTVVFLKSTKSARDFTCEVALAQGEV